MEQQSSAGSLVKRLTSERLYNSRTQQNSKVAKPLPKALFTFHMTFQAGGAVVFSQPHLFEVQEWLSSTTLKHPLKLASYHSTPLIVLVQISMSGLDGSFMWLLPGLIQANGIQITHYDTLWYIMTVYSYFNSCIACAKLPNRRWSHNHQHHWRKIMQRLLPQQHDLSSWHITNSCNVVDSHALLLPCSQTTLGWFVLVLASNSSMSSMYCKLWGGYQTGNIVEHISLYTYKYI